MTWEFRPCVSLDALTMTQTLEADRTPQLESGSIAALKTPSENLEVLQECLLRYHACITSQKFYKALFWEANDEWREETARSTLL